MYSFGTNGFFKIPELDGSIQGTCNQTLLRERKLASTDGIFMPGESMIRSHSFQTPYHSLMLC